MQEEWKPTREKRKKRREKTYRPMYGANAADGLQSIEGRACALAFAAAK